MGRRGPWTDQDRQDLHTAIELRGHGQPQCAEELRALGLKADQSAVSKWLHDRVPHARTAGILRAYIEASPGVGSGGADGPPAEDRMRTSMEERFDESVSVLSDEPLLGPRQGAAIDALLERLRVGPVMSEQDETALREVFRVLRLAEHG